MDDALLKAYTRFYEKISLFSEEKQNDLKSELRAIIELEQSKIKNTQLITVKALHITEGDQLLDLETKRLSTVSHAEYRKNCQFNIDKSNKQILIMYENEESGDYFDEFSEVYILADISEIANIKNRPEPVWEEEDF